MLALTSIMDTNVNPLDKVIEMFREAYPGASLAGLDGTRIRSILAGKIRFQVVPSRVQRTNPNKLMAVSPAGVKAVAEKRERPTRVRTEVDEIAKMEREIARLKALLAA